MADKHIDRKQLLKEPDEFFTTTGRVLEWVKAHTKETIYGLCAILGALIIISGYRYFDVKRAASASDLLGKTLNTYQIETAKSDAVQALGKVEADFKRLISDYSGQPAGRLGLIYYAHAGLAARQSDTAIDLYQRAMGHFGGDPSLTNILSLGLGAAYEQKGDTAAAIVQYEKIAQGASQANKPDALFRLGRLYKAAGQKDKSVEAFKRLSNEFPDSIYAAPAAEQAAG
jgi:tetratricopeptide (TPR) repeat protein